MGAEIVARDLGEDVAAKLEYTFLSRLYAVDDLEVRRRLAERIASGELAGVAAKMEIAREAKKERHGGRPPRAEVDVALGELDRAFRKWERAGAFGGDNLKELGRAGLALAKKARRLAAEIVRVADELEEAART